MVEVDLVISSKFRNLLPAPADEEKKQLEENLKRDGRVIDPILYWHDGSRNLIVDGMNRYPLAKKLGIPYRTEPMVFTNTNEAELWILEHQLGRRNLLKPNEIRRVRGELYNRMKGERGGKHPPEIEAKGQNVPLVTSGGVNAAKHVAEKAGVDEKTVKRDGKRVETIASLATPVAAAVNKGDLEVTDAQLAVLAKADTTKQMEVARAVRTGQAKSTKEAMEKAGLRNGKPSKGKESGQSAAAKLVDELTRSHVGKLVRGLDAVAKANGGKGPVHREADEAINTFIGCLKKMRGGER